MALWKDIVRIVMPIVGVAIGGPVGAALGVAAAKAIPADTKDVFETWKQYAQELEDDDELTNNERADRLRARIRLDLYKASGEEPKERRVDWFSETIVMAINGDFGDDI